MTTLQKPEVRKAVYAVAAAVFVLLNALGVTVIGGSEVWLPVVDTVIGVFISLLARKNVNA